MSAQVVQTQPVRGTRFAIGMALDKRREMAERLIAHRLGRQQHQPASGLSAFNLAGFTTWERHGGHHPDDGLNAGLLAGSGKSRGPVKRVGIRERQVR
jgi:hypothetical protein